MKKILILLLVFLFSFSTVYAIEFEDLTIKGTLSRPNQSGCSVIMSDNVVTTTNNLITIPFDTEEWDNQDEWNTSTYRFTAKTAGCYYVVLSTHWSILAINADYPSYIYKNGSIIHLLYWVSGGGSTTNQTFVTEALVYLDVDDYIEFKTQSEQNDDQLKAVGTYADIVKLW